MTKMQPWRPRQGVFSAYEREWRAERDLAVELANANKRKKGTRRPLRNRKSEKELEKTGPSAVLDESVESLYAMDDEALLERARHTLVVRRFNVKEQKVPRCAFPTGPLPHARAAAFRGAAPPPRSAAPRAPLFLFLVGVR